MYLPSSSLSYWPNGCHRRPMKQTKTREELLRLAPVQAEIANVQKQGEEYSAALMVNYGARLKLRTFAVVAIGFEKLVWQAISV